MSWGCVHVTLAIRADAKRYSLGPKGTRGLLFMFIPLQSQDDVCKGLCGDEKNTVWEPADLCSLLAFLVNCVSFLGQDDFLSWVLQDSNESL